MKSGEATGVRDVHVSTFDALGSIQDIAFSNITGTTRASWGSLVSATNANGSTSVLKNISFTNVVVKDGGGGATRVPPDPAEYAGAYPDA